MNGRRHKDEIHHVVAGRPIWVSIGASPLRALDGTIRGTSWQGAYPGGGARQPGASPEANMWG